MTLAEEEAEVRARLSAPGNGCPRPFMDRLNFLVGTMRAAERPSARCRSARRNGSSPRSPGIASPDHPVGCRGAGSRTVRLATAGSPLQRKRARNGTRFAVLGPDDLVLEMVQRHDSPAEAPDQLPPRGAGKGANITNVLQRVVIGDQAKGAGIVKSGRAPYMDWDSSEFQAFPVRR
jgi:hypothetical protein